MGMIYALLGMGLILLVRAVGILNFAQGDLMMFGAYIAACLLLDFELPIYILIPLAIVWFALMGIIFMFTIYWPLRKASYAQATIIATMGASIALQELAKLIWGSQPRTMPAIIQNEDGTAAVLRIGNLALQWQYLVIIVVGIVIIWLVTQLFDKLYVGKMMQAACQDSYAANLLGVPSILTICATYMIDLIVCGVCGYLVAPIFMVRSTLGTLQLRAFAGVVIGGFGNITGAVIGCILVGIIESFSTMAFSGYKDVTVFLLLIVFLVFRPTGLFKSKIGDKAEGRAEYEEFIEYLKKDRDPVSDPAHRRCRFLFYCEECL